MESQNLKHRSRDDPRFTTTTSNEKNRANRREKRMAMAKRGLRSLVIAVSFPLSLTLLNIYLFGSGGFHVKPTALSLYLGYLGLSMAWHPIVLWMGASWAGLLVSLAMVGTLVGCSRDFGKVNPIAGNSVMPCLAWAAFLAT
ncbi:hypothetical protein Goarm_005933, partial [Gossypium armourianum]|nr:hypothetical protein [Gossypium armourianum]